MISLVSNCWPLFIALGCYLCQGLILAFRPDFWQSLIYFAYAAANVGLIAVAMRGAT